jgi:hypothetical protein
MELEIIEKYKLLKLQERCKNFFRGVWFLTFLLLRLVLENMSGTKFVVQTLLFPTKKSLIGLEVCKTV